MKKDNFTCPRCGLQTVQEVQEWNHDFLAVHKYEKRIVQGVGGLVECEVFEGCDKFGPLPRIPRVLIEIKPIKPKAIKSKVTEKNKSQNSLNRFSKSESNPCSKSKAVSLASLRSLSPIFAFESQNSSEMGYLLQTRLSR